MPFLLLLRGREGTGLIYVLGHSIRIQGITVCLAKHHECCVDRNIVAVFAVAFFFTFYYFFPYRLSVKYPLDFFLFFFVAGGGQA